MDNCTGPVASWATWQIAERAAILLLEREYDRKTVPYVVESISRDMLNAISMLFLKKDEPVPPNPTTGWSLADEEPPSVSVDSWARGAVPVRFKPKAVASEALELPGSSRARSPSARSAASSSKRRGMGSAQGSRNESALSGGAASPALSGAQPASSSRQASSKPGSAAGRRGQGEAAQRPASAARIAMEAALKAEQEQLAATQASFKGRDFSYDHRGNVIELSSVDPDRLPKTVVDPRVAVRNPAVSGADASAGSGLRGLQAAKRNKSTGSSTVPRKKTLADASVVKTSSVKFVDDVLPQAGVTLRDGSLTRVGPRPEHDRVHMSRKEFATAQAAASLQMTQSKGSLAAARRAALAEQQQQQQQQQQMFPRETQGQDPAAAAKRPSVVDNDQLDSSGAEENSRGMRMGSLHRNGNTQLATGNPLSKSIKSRKDRSAFAPVSSNDRFASMRRSAGVAGAGSGVGVAGLSAGIGAASRQEKTVVANPALARALLD